MSQGRRGAWRFTAAIFCSVLLMCGGPLGHAADVDRAAAESTPANVITDIQFTGNKKTRPRTMLQEMLVRVGDPADPDKIEMSRQAIMDLELFQRVEAQLKPDDRGQILLIKVKEKHYLLPLPRLSRNADGDIRYGAQLRHDNLAGLNQKLDLKYEIKELSENEVDEERSYSIDYTYPRVGGSAYQLDVALGQEESDIDRARGGLQGLYLKNQDTASFGVSRWVHLKGPSRGWRANLGVSYSDTAYELVSGDPGLFTGGRVVALRTGVAYTDVRNFLFSRTGSEYGYGIEVASPNLDSETSYTSHSLYYRRFQHVGDKPHTNLNYQLKAGISNNDLFGEEFYSLGGGDTLRGYGRNDIEGNAFLLANIEYLRPLRDKPVLRGLVFVDVGNAYEDFDDIDLGDLLFGVGAGIRWKIKSFVKLDLRIDAAYAVDTGESKAYVGTKQTF